jgi:hypothetical protein
VNGEGGTRDRAVAAVLLEKLLRYAGDPLQSIEFEIDEANMGLWTVLQKLGIAARQVTGNFAEQ